MLDFVALALFPGLMLFAALSDIMTMTIPNRVSIILIAGFFVMAVWTGMAPSAIGWHVAAGACMLALCFVLFNLGWVGGGDAKLAASTALWFGFAPLADYGVVTAILGGLLTLIIVGLRQIELPNALRGRAWLARLHDSRSGIPYGVALAGAGLAVYPHTAVWLAAVAK